MFGDKESILSVAYFIENKICQQKQIMLQQNSSCDDTIIQLAVINCLDSLFKYCSTQDQKFLSTFKSNSDISQEISMLYLYDEMTTLLVDLESSRTYNLVTLENYINSKLNAFKYLIKLIRS